MSELPPGWTSATVAELIAPDGIFSDGDWVESKDQDPTGAIRLLQLADVGDGVFVDKSNRFVNDDKFEQLRCTEVFEGDVLIARMPDPLGRACLAPKLRQRCITVVDVAIVRPGPSSVRSKWLMHFLNAPPVRQVIELKSSGTTRRRISRGNLAQLELPIPPLPEQKRIADKLDVLLARVDACRGRLDRVPGILKRFRQSVLAAATSGDLTREWRKEHNHTDPWPHRRIEDVTTKVGSGATPKGGEAAYKIEGVPFIRSMNVVFYGFRRDGLAYLDPEQARELRNVEVQARDVLLNITGASIGRVTLAPDDLDGARVNQHVAIIRPTDELLPEFLCWFLAAPGMQAIIGGENYGVTRPALTKQLIIEFRVPVPSIVEQREIIRRVAALFGYADNIEAHLAKARVRVSKLVPSVLSTAFQGELVPQDPNDEPAPELLAKLKVEQSNAAAERPRSRPKQTGKRPTMSNTDKDAIRAAILKLKTDRFSFDELRAQVAGDYESVKAALFELLEEPSPAVRQVFDKKAKAMRLVRVRP